MSVTPSCNDYYRDFILVHWNLSSQCVRLKDLPPRKGVHSQEMPGTEVPLGISAIRYKDRYRFSNCSITIGIYLKLLQPWSPHFITVFTSFMPRYSNVKGHRLFKDKFTYSRSLVGILMGLTFALKQDIKIIRILKLLRYPPPPPPPP